MLVQVCGQHACPILKISTACRDFWEHGTASQFEWQVFTSGVMPEKRTNTYKVQYHLQNGSRSAICAWIFTKRGLPVLYTAKYTTTATAVEWHSKTILLCCYAGISWCLPAKCAHPTQPFDSYCCMIRGGDWLYLCYYNSTDLLHQYEQY